MVHALKSHLFWFVVLGASIFAIDAFWSSSEDIIVDESVALRLAGMWQGQMGRPPTTGELTRLLENWVDEELLYRKATALELDKGDAIVRRRLIQKVTFIAEQDAMAEPGEAELQEWFEDNGESYRLPVRLSFNQFRLPKDVSGEEVQRQLEAGAEWRSLGAPSMQNPSYGLLSMREVQSVFGSEFADAIFDFNASEQWQGPVVSEFGRHLVQVIERREPEMPAFDRVVAKVRNDYLQAKRDDAKAQYLSNLRSEFNVEWRVE